MDLSKEELENFRMLLIITQQIYETYADLTDDEICDLKNSLQYQSTMDVLLDLIFQEEDYYNSIKDNEKLLANLINLVDKLEVYNFPDALMGVKVGTDAYLIKQRVSNRLLSLFDHYVATNDWLDNNEFGEDDSKEEIFDIDLELSEQIQEDFLKTLLKILSIYLNDKAYQDLKDYFIVYKYRLAFVFPTVENNFLKTDFVIDDEAYLSYLFTAKKVGIEESEDLEECIDAEIVPIIYGEIEHLLELYYTSDNDKEIIFTSTMAQIIVRACLLFISSQEMYEFINQINDEIANLYGKNPLADKIVYDALNSLKDDKNLISIITDIKERL